MSTNGLVEAFHQAAHGRAGTRLAFSGIHGREWISMLWTLLVVLLLLSLFGGGWGSRRGYGYWGWSPLGLLLLIVLIMALTGNLNL